MKQPREWIAAKAARKAENIQLATTEHLIHDETAVQLIRASLRARWSAFRKDDYADHAATAMVYSAYGYKPDFSDTNLDKLAKTILAEEAAELAKAELYTLSPQMCEVVIAAALSLTDEDIALINFDEDSASRNGYIILPSAVKLESLSHAVENFRAIRWSEPKELTVYDPHKSKLLKMPGFKMSAYVQLEDVQPRKIRENSTVKDKSVVPLVHAVSGLLLSSEADVEALEQVWQENLQKTNEFVENTRRKAGIVDDITEVNFDSSAHIPDPTGTFATRFMYAFWRLHAQKIARVEKEPVAPSLSATTRKEHAARDINIVYLREEEVDPSQSKENFHSAVEWKKRWVVRMHKVRQWYPKEGRHRVIFRGPFTKGPKHLPIAPPTKRVNVLGR